MIGKENESPPLMIGKPNEFPSDVARRFFKDLRAFLAEKNTTKADGIAARQLQVLRQYQGPREKKLRLSDVKQIFLQMKDQAWGPGTLTKDYRCCARKKGVNLSNISSRWRSISHVRASFHPGACWWIISRVAVTLTGLPSTVIQPIKALPSHSIVFARSVDMHKILKEKEPPGLADGLIVLLLGWLVQHQIYCIVVFF
jgi:hypothetical protein